MESETDGVERGAGLADLVDPVLFHDFDLVRGNGSATSPEETAVRSPFCFEKGTHFPKELDMASVVA